MINLLLASGPTFWFPVQASTDAHKVDWLFYFIYYVSLVFFVLIAVLLFWFCIRYRRTHEDQIPGRITHNTALELSWTILPSILLVPMFWWGFEGFLEARTPPENTYDINVVAIKWKWQFFYPNGYDDQYLHVPGDTPVRLIMRSDDVLHSCFIPAFRVKRDVVPGRYAFLWFNAKSDPDKKVLEFPLLCAEYCGTSHSDMNTTVFVHPDRKSFDEWLENADPLSPKNMTPEMYDLYKSDAAAFFAKHPELKERLKPPLEKGMELYEKKGCSQCHAVKVGGPQTQCPSFVDVYGHNVEFTSGPPVVADENYLRESIVNPQARIVKGYTGIMPKIAVSEREVDCLITYIKSLSDKGRQK